MTSPTAPRPCNCGGGGSSSGTSTASGGSFQIQLRNGNFVGRFGTSTQAEHALRTTFKGAGKVVPR